MKDINEVVLFNGRFTESDTLYPMIFLSEGLVTRHDIREIAKITGALFECLVLLPKSKRLDFIKEIGELSNKFANTIKEEYGGKEWI